jgi:hypothetical protein
MKYLFRVFLVSFVLSVNNANSFGQTIIDSFKIGNHNYPKPSVKNIIHWLNISTKDWEVEMKIFEFSSRGIHRGGVYYSSPQIDKYVYTITKFPDKTIDIDWANWGNGGLTILDDLVNELEPYFQQTNENGFSIYQYKTVDAIYKFWIKRDRDELMGVKMFPN